MNLKHYRIDSLGTIHVMSMLSPLLCSRSYSCTLKSLNEHNFKTVIDLYRANKYSVILIRPDFGTLVVSQKCLKK